MSLHPRLSVSTVSSWNWSLEEDLAFYAEAGIDAIGIELRKLDDHADLAALATRLDDAGIHLTDLLAPGPFSLDAPERWPEQRDAMGRIMDAALTLRPDVLVLTTGAAGVLPWERAADAFADILRGSVREAEREGLRIAVEHTHALRTDVGFVHTLRDAVELAWRVDIGVCVELQACWAERNLAGTIAAAIDVIELVQVSDFAIGTTSTPDRLVPGRGDLPLRRLLGHLLDAGYEGRFELELVGPRIEEQGYAEAIREGVDHLTEVIDELLHEDDEDDDSDDGSDVPDDGDGPPGESGGAPPDWALFPGST